MAFLESPRLFDCYALGAQGGPQFNTTVAKTSGGQRYANANWLYPLHVYDLSSAVKTQEEFAVIRNFFYNVGGRRDGFRFKDWADYRATNQPLVLITGSTYQLTKAYVTGPRTFSRPIYKPAVVAVTRTRSGVTSTPSFSLDTTTGRVTISGHVAGDTYTWTGEFDVPVAFVSDQLERQIVNKGKGGFLIEWPSIQIEELRL